jgi:hypothetical protein
MKVKIHAYIIDGFKLRVIFDEKGAPWFIHQDAIVAVNNGANPDSVIKLAKRLKSEYLKKLS